MDRIESLKQLTEFGRIRLSQNFFMRDMLHSEVGNFFGVPNFPDTPELALEAGEKLAQLILEPLISAFGHISIRSAYRSATLNAYCHKLYTQGVADAWCTSNEDNAAHHIWDLRDREGFLGAAATIVIPSYLRQFEMNHDWRPLGWWMRDNLEHYASIQFFPSLCAFNIQWYEGPSAKSITYLDPPTRIELTGRGRTDFDGDHSDRYAHLIPTAC